MDKQHCKFYLRGYCSRGSSCFYLHEHTNSIADALTAIGPKKPFSSRAQQKASGRGLSAESPEFVAGRAFTAVGDDTGSVPCRFFASTRGCRNGDSCRFSHDVASSPPATIATPNTRRPSSSDAGSSVIMSPTSHTSSRARRRESTDTAITNISTDNGPPTSSMAALKLDNKKPRGENTRTIDGATVTFLDGAEVSSLELPTDYSTVQITGLPSDCTSQSLVTLFSSRGLTVSASSIKFRVISAEGSSITEVSSREPGFADSVVQKLNGSGRIRATVMQAHNVSSTSANRLQLSSVSCTWYKPSRVAWLNYTDEKAATTAKKVFEKRKINGRTTAVNLKTNWASDTGRGSFTLILTNLDALATEALIYRALGRAARPDSFNLNEPNYDIPSTDYQGTIVKRRLAAYGKIESWEIFDDAANTKVKAVARFSSVDDAKKAANEVNNTVVREFANSKVFATIMASVKFKVLTQIYRAVEYEINLLRREVEDAPMHVHIKYYPVTDPFQRTTYLRVSGGDIKSVAKVKGQIEKILRGTLVENDQGPLWHQFFASPEALVYFKELQGMYSTFIYSDLKRSRLTVYGSSVDGVNRTEDALHKKVEELQKEAKSINLIPKQVHWLLKGGLRALQSLLGFQNASFSIKQQTPVVEINGDTADVDKSLELLRTMPSSSSEREAPTQQNDGDCAVCWTEATDGFHTECGHLFCKDCFANLCSSAGDDSQFPIKCVALSGTSMCGRTISLKELSSTLSPKDFEKLLETSVSSYVRKLPGTYQYCPTPDCEQIYRVGGSKSFTCPNCLTTLCTSCHISHEGLTCAESKDLRSGGDAAFKRWKEQNNVKDCPKCKTSIEKTEGCNHMECKGCTAHICWKCLKYFETSRECYDHLIKEHGGHSDGMEHWARFF